jgi:hypothetical protein
MRRREIIILVVGLVIGIALGVLINEETSLFGTAGGGTSCRQAQRGYDRLLSDLAKMQADLDTATAACNSGDQAACTTAAELQTEIADAETQKAMIEDWLKTNNCN